MTVHPYNPFDDPDADGLQDDVTPGTEPPKPDEPDDDGSDPPW